jgi:hypothetical protein
LGANAIDKIIFSDASESSAVVGCVSWGKLATSAHQIVSTLAGAGSAVPNGVVRAFAANVTDEVVA